MGYCALSKNQIIGDNNIDYIETDNDKIQRTEIMMYNKDNNSFVYTDERFADLQMLRYRLEGFETLSLRQKIYIYYLAKPALSGRDMLTDQFRK